MSFNKNVICKWGFVFNVNFYSQKSFVDKLFVRIRQCQDETMDSSTSKENHDCIYKIIGHGEVAQLDCIVNGTRRNTHVYWDDSINVSPDYVLRGDGTYDVTATITIPIADVDGNKTFTCNAQGHSSSESAEQSVFVIASQDSAGKYMSCIADLQSQLRYNNTKNTRPLIKQHLCMLDLIVWKLIRYFMVKGTL